MAETGRSIKIVKKVARIILIKNLLRVVFRKVR